MNSWKFWSCVTLSDGDYEFSMNNDLNHTNSIPLSPAPSSPPLSASSNGNLPSNAFVKGLILTKDEIISLINDFNLDPHSYRLNSSLIISAKCADYRPAKAILLCVCHHALIMHGKVSDLSICKSILEVYKSHSKKPSIIMLSYASVLSLLLNESNHDQFIEFGLHRCLASPYDSWKYNPNESIESSKLSLLCWKIVIIAILTAHNLETRKTFGDASSCEWIVQVLEELLKLSKELSLNSQSVLSGSPRISSAHAPAPVPLPNLINTFVISCCVALIHLTKDYRTNFQKISSITLDTGSRFDLFLEEILVPSRRMQYSILTDDTWSGLSLTKEYFQVNLQCSVQLPPPPPALSSLCPTSPSQLVSIPDPLTALLQRYSPTSSYFPSLVSMVLVDTITFLHAREEQALSSSPDASDINPLFTPYYSQLMCALEAFTTYQSYKIQIKFLHEKSVNEQQTIEETKMELQSLSEQLQKEQDLSSELQTELETVENQLKLAEFEHQKLVEKLEKTKIESKKKLENYQQLELAQAESVAAIMNARARAELEYEEVSYKHQTELQKVTEIFQLKNSRKRSLSIHPDSPHGVGISPSVSDMSTSKR